MILRKTTVWILVLIGSNLWSQKEPENVAVLVEEFIFEDAGFPQCHASTLVSLENGEVLAAWFGGEYERHPNVSIYSSRLNGSGWSKPEIVADGIINDTLRYPTWNPVLFRSSTERLFLFYKIGPSPSGWWGAYKTSGDQGRSWSEPKKLSGNILGPIKNKPIQVGERILSPSSTESEDGLRWNSHIEISDDDGKSWRKVSIDTVSGYRTIQPAIINLGGKLKALLRSDQDVIMESVSEDEGESWSGLKRTSIPNPNSGIDAVTLKNGKHLLVYNPLVSGENWQNGRNKLFVAFSEDGENWKDILKLEDKPEGEFSYPAIIEDGEGNIHISYTYNREKIKYIKLKIN